jgi:hypothetical protein
VGGAAKGVGLHAPSIIGVFLPVNRYTGQADVIIAHAAEAGQNLGEGRHDKIFAVSEKQQNLVEIIFMKFLKSQYEGALIGSRQTHLN